MLSVSDICSPRSICWCWDMYRQVFVLWLKSCGNVIIKWREPTSSSLCHRPTETDIFGKLIWITSAAIGQVLLYGAGNMKKSKISNRCLRQEIWNENLKVWICFCITVTQYVSLQLCKQSVLFVVTVWGYDGKCNAKCDYCLLQICQCGCTLDTCPPVASGQQNNCFRLPKPTYGILFISSNKAPSILQQNRLVCFRYDINFSHNWMKILHYNITYT